MAKHQVTYGQLKALCEDIMRQQNTSPSFFFFQKNRTERFFAQNTMAIKVLESRMNEFLKKYVKHDENQQPLTEEKDGGRVYSFESDEIKQKYLDAVNNFLSLKISIGL